MMKIVYVGEYDRQESRDSKTVFMKDVPVEVSDEAGRALLARANGDFRQADEPAKAQEANT